MSSYDQLSIFDFIYPEQSKCKNCFYEDNGQCICSNSKYNMINVPRNGCIYFDSVQGGIPGYEELKGLL